MSVHFHDKNTHSLAKFTLLFWRKYAFLKNSRAFSLNISSSRVHVTFASKYNVNERLMICYSSSCLSHRGSQAQRPEIEMLRTISRPKGWLQYFWLCKDPLLLCYESENCANVFVEHFSIISCVVDSKRHRQLTVRPTKLTALTLSSKAQYEENDNLI